MLLLPLCRADVVLSIVPASQTVAPGSQVSLDVYVSGLGGGSALGVYDINIGFDSTVLSYSSISFGNQINISGTGDVQIVTPGVGTVEVFELSLDSVTNLNSLQTPAFRLATLKFSMSASGGSSPITLSVNALGDASGNSITARIQNGSVTAGAATPADLTITAQHPAVMIQGDMADPLTLTVSNVGAGPTVGVVTVMDMLPSGLIATAISGDGWICDLGTLTCTRSDVLNPGANYSSITITVQVAAMAASNLTNTTTVSGGGEVNTANDTATDQIIISPAGTTPDLFNLFSSGSSTRNGVGVIPSTK